MSQSDDDEEEKDDTLSKTFEPYKILTILVFRA
jgi:hypothetical protein